MRLVMSVLCVGGVTFLLCVLVALVREWLSLTPRAEMFYLAKFNPSRPRGGLIMIDSKARRPKVSAETDQRRAI